MRIHSARLLLSAACMLLLGACGGGSDPGFSEAPPIAQPTAVTSIGKITGFGSVYVNGVKFATDGSTYDVDDAPASGDEALAVGMIVKVSGTVNPDGISGRAVKIKYDDEIEGRVEGLAVDPADADILTFSVMGVTVIATRQTRFDGEDDPAFSFDTIGDGDNVEISGEFHADVLHASYIEKQDADDDDFEARGFVSQFNGTDRFTLTLRNGGTLQITVAPGATIPAAGIVDGQFVEVEGTIPDPVNAPRALLAVKVELEDHDGLEDDDDEVELRGVLNHDAETDSWSIRDVLLAFDANTEYEPRSLVERIADGSADGLIVEVEGRHTDGGLLVREIEIEHDVNDDLGFNAIVAAISIGADDHNGTITLSFGGATGTVDVVVDNRTLFVNDHAMQPFGLGDIAVGDFLDIDARRAADGSIRATSLHREDGPGIEIEGPVDSIDDVSITVVGVTFTLGAGTLFPEGEPVVGDFVEIEDENADGTADVVELED